MPASMAAPQAGGAGPYVARRRSAPRSRTPTLAFESRAAPDCGLATGPTITSGPSRAAPAVL
eukprot:10681285-Alexandrium_andersonii.AAC.1